MKPRSPIATMLCAGLLCTGLLCAGLPGCAALSGRAAGRAAERATQSSFAELAEPRTGDAIATLLSDPRIAAAIQELTAGVANAMLDELTDEERGARIEDALTRFATRLGPALGGTFSDALVERVPGLTRSLLTTAAGERAQLTAIAAALTAGVSEALATGLREELGPAARDVIARDVAEGMAAALENERLDRAIGRVARTFGREAVFGASEAAREVGDEPGTLLSTLGETAERGNRLFRELSVALGVGVVIFVALFVWALLLARRRRKESEAKDAALLLLASVVKVAAEEPWGPKLIELLRVRMKHQPGARHLRTLLDAHPELRVHVPKEPPPREAPAGGSPQPA